METKGSFLPEKIDYSHYYGNGGMSSKHFGPSAWNYLFMSILGRYPIKIDKSNKEHMEIAKSYYQTIINLQSTLPCVYCRNSFKNFIQELPINKYLVGRIELMYWLYLMKDKVNNKLINQEKELFESEKQKLKQMREDKKITLATYNKRLKKAKKKIFLTAPTPPFKKVLDHFEKYRAKCQEKTQKCSLK